MQAQKTVEDFLAKHVRWNKVLMQFREILLQTELDESIKWGIPVYSLSGKNVLGIGAFKSYVGLWFYQGAFLTDPRKVLINAQEGKTKAMRQLRFTSEDDIDLAMVRSYIDEAIKNQKAGKEMKPDNSKPVVIPKELQAVLDEDIQLKSAFDQFSPGKQREFTEHISEAKQETTRQKRVEKIIPMIKEGIGLNDKYKRR